MGIPSAACTHAIWRGSWWCGRPFALLFDCEFLFPSEPHLLRQSRSQVQKEGVGGGLRGQPSWLGDWNWGKRVNQGMDKTQGRWQISVGDVVPVKCRYNQGRSIENFWNLPSNVTFIFSPDGTKRFSKGDKYPWPCCPYLAKRLADKQGTNGNWRKWRERKKTPLSGMR